MPDKHPLVPGHTLIISKAHWRCYGSTPPRVLDELHEATTRVRTFLESRYGSPVLINETGKTGQTVFHAHLHISPHPKVRLPLPSSFLTHPDVTMALGWQTVRERFARQGEYYYLELGGQRFIVDSYYSPAVDILRQVVADALNVGHTDRRLDRMASSLDVNALTSQWIEWSNCVP